MKKNILIVDDEKKIRDTYKQVLEREGYMPLAVGDAVEARNILMRNPVDLILLDINMDGVRGDELFYVIKAFHQNVKVIVASVYPIYEQKKAVFRADAYFDKSEGTRVLIEKIKAQFDEDAVNSGTDDFSIF